MIRKNGRYLLMGALGVFLILWNGLVLDGPNWLVAFGAAVGGMLIVQAIYGRWIKDYQQWLHEAHEGIERLVGHFERIGAARQGRN